ncbi:MAG: hypothetical protein EA394_04820 [Bacteroidia bacterium]|nr:MAG: hypothetical protein EA394_04820 [Bacteroidia bacterium]
MANTGNEKSESRLLRKYLELQNEFGIYEKIINSLDAIILILDFNKSNIIYANSRYEKVTGYPATMQADFDTNELISLYHPEDQCYLDEAVEYLLGNPEGTFTAFYRFRHAKGHYLWLFSSSQVFRLLPEEDIFEIITVSLDFTRPVKYEKSMKNFVKDRLRGLNSAEVSKISKRELEVLKLFVAGFTTRAVAAKLNISHHTVNNHRKNMLKKLGLKNLAALVNFAVESGID